MSEVERFDVVSMLGGEPDAGDLIQGTGGVRKVRFAGKGKGKSGGYRVITFYYSPTTPVFLLSVYAKNTKVNLSKAERNALARLTEALVSSYARKIVPIPSRTR